jgi:lipoate-protein ligase A
LRRERWSVTSTSFELLEFDESPRVFHGRDLPAVPTPQVWWNRLTERALVLGSTQRDESIVDAAACAAGGIDVVRRRSGGGAVLLVPDEVVWFDVIIPAGAVSGLGDDVHAPMLWLGERIASVLEPLVQRQVEGAVTVKGPGMASTPWSSLICFDGFGPGEVLLGGRKLVGISQRRTRTASRLQCCWYRRYDPAQLVDLLAADVRPSVSDLSAVATLDVTDTADTGAEGAVLADLAEGL